MNTTTHNTPKSHWLYNPKYRSIVFQLITVIVLGYGLFTIVANTMSNLESRGITTGFDFLNQTAGFGIGFTLIDYDETYSYGRTFFVGLLNTALVSILGIIFATLIGFIIGIARLSRNWLINRCAAVYIEIFRNIPLLLQILFWYVAVLQTLPSARQSYHLGESLFLNVRGLYLPAPVFNNGSGWVAISVLVGIGATLLIALWTKRRFYNTGQTHSVWPYGLVLIFILPLVVFWSLGSPISADYPVLKGFNFRGGLTVLPELVALWFALSIYTASFIAEIVRSGINAVEHGQSEAAMSLGLSRNKTLRLIVIPQAMLIIIPPLTSQYLNLTKNSSLATAIGYPDLVAVFAGTTMNQTGQAIEIIAMTMGVYLTLSIVTSLLMNLYNKKMALVER
ncbi:amino acid ABC transporter permease [Vibrio zhugei]|uniref:Amino acid ABC transporter permease n=1 Tax=Vibrio zhugei TaxID=2479546 RepID=A0ABV7CBV2_9VIBR|nr:amino acid ABC transporter permease [Vibrio zhugei]